MTVLIMCQGEQRRLAKLGHPKQLLEVAGETVLARTVRLVRERCPDRNVIVIARMDGFRAAGDEIGVLVAEIAEPGSCIVDGLYASRLVWSPGRTTALLGDVVWSVDAITRVLEDDRQLVFAGTPEISTNAGEVFAASWDARAQIVTGYTVQRLMETCPCRADLKARRPRRFARQQGGHLRRLLWWTQQLKGYQGKCPMPELHLAISDYTDDIDTPDDVANIGKLITAVEADKNLPLP